MPANCEETIAASSLLTISKSQPWRYATREALDEGFRFEVDVLSTDVHIELKRLNGQPVLVEMLTQQCRSDYRPFHGHVTSASLLGSDGGLARYRLTVEPWLAFFATGATKVDPEFKTVI